MPELPEVETVRRGLLRNVHRMRVATTRLRRADLRWRVPAAAFAALQGATLADVHRRSKYLLLRFDGDQVALVHLGMSGRLLVTRHHAGSRLPWLRHEHWRLYFDELVLRFIDARRFGVLDVVGAADLANHRLLRGLGPEPFDAVFDAEYFHARSRQRKVSVKNFVMDARHVVGVGNIYASEVCFAAGVRPRRRAGSLTRHECRQLVAAVRSVLQAAIRRGGTTLRDYLGVDSEAGYFGQELMVYGRAGEPCRHCGTHIKRVREGGRSTFYCCGCQR
jgi:formamidopyrimidine-DNA glycosylase